MQATQVRLPHSIGISRQQHLAAAVVANLPAAPRRLGVRSAASSGTSSSSSFDPSSNDEDRIWSQLAFPSYLQSKNKHKPEVCREFDKAVTAAERRQARGVLGLAASAESSYDDDEEDEEWEPETVWHTIRREAERDAAAEPLLSSFLYASILAHDTFERALAFVLSNRLANAVMLPTQLFEIFHEVLIGEPDVREAALADVEACRERDPACTSYSQALLYYKGYHAIQTHRIAHALWVRGQKVMAVALQSRMSEVLAVDIHPAACFGRGILLDHGTGVVIGETAVIGNNVSLLQNVTLGGTGKDHGDRHPKISDNVLIGACATVLGNIRVGEGAQIAAGSLVLKPVVPHTMVAGSPAKPVGHVTGNPAEKMQQWSKKLLNWDPFAEQPPPAAAQQRQQQQPSPLPQQPEASGRAQPAAVGGNGAAAAASKPSGRRVPKSTRHSIAANEARWDAVAAQVSAAGGASSALPSSSSSSSSASSSVGSGRSMANGVPKGWANGAALPASNGNSRVSMANGSSVAPSSTRSAAAAPAAAASQRQPPPQQQQQQQQQQQDQPSHSAAQPPAAVPAQAAAAAAAAGPSGSAGAEEQVSAAAAGRKQASAGLRGIHEGDVEATLDEEVAAEKWSSRKEEPEYVI